VLASLNASATTWETMVIVLVTRATKHTRTHHTRFNDKLHF